MPTMKQYRMFYNRVLKVSKLLGVSRVQALVELRKAKSQGINSAAFIESLRKQKTEEQKSAPISEFVSEEGLRVYMYIDESGNRCAAVCGRNNTKPDLVIPEDIQGTPVRRVRSRAFANDENLISVDLPDGIDFIGAEAFSSCTHLEFVKLPLDLPVIQRSTFEGCTQLEKVVLPYGLKRIARNVFKDCVNLRSLDHYMKRGISATMTVDYNLVESNLPSSLEHIGQSAFEGCGSIKEVYIPYKVKQIPARAYAKCTSLKRVDFHNNVEVIDEMAFEGCSSLSSVHVPASMKSIDADAFDKTTTVSYDAEISQELREQLGKRSGFRCIPNHALAISSVMGATNSGNRVECFYTEEDMRVAQEAYELRNCAPLAQTTKDVPDLACNAARFVLKQGVYTQVDTRDDSTGSARIMLTGDLMCRPRQQKTAYDRADGSFDFSASFASVSPLLQQADLVIGNLESMVAHSYSVSKDVDFVDDRAYLNAPDEYLRDVRNAGFDVVMNAQNHAYDVGTQGVFETLDALNRAHLIHGGMYASEGDPHYIVIDVNGIRIGLVGFLDQARQKMKRASFTDRGLEALFSPFEPERVQADIAAARQAGAEYVIAYCHWGREYTDVITKRQSGFAQMVADAGADFLFGSHSHCLQPFGMLESSDGRQVPVLYSGGNFVSDMSIYAPYNYDTIVVDLTLSRDTDGTVRLESAGYHPCCIDADANRRGYVAVQPLASIYDNASRDKQITLDETLLRIQQTIGESDSFVMLDRDKFSLRLLDESTPPRLRLNTMNIKSLNLS